MTNHEKYKELMQRIYIANRDYRKLNNVPNRLFIDKDTLEFLKQYCFEMMPILDNKKHGYKIMNMEIEVVYSEKEKIYIGYVEEA